MIDDNEEIIIDEDIQNYMENCEFKDFRLNPIYLPYSQWRIKQIFLDYYGCELRPYFMWYKAMRYQSCQRYVITCISDNSIVGSEFGYTLEQLRYFLAENMFPLHEDTSIEKDRKKAEEKEKRKQKRNIMADYFLEFVKNIGDD